MSKHKNDLKRVLPFIFVLILIIGWSVFLYFHPPEELVDVLGVSNSYWVAFLISVLGALSSFTTFSTYPAIVTMAVGDINPFLLGGVAGIGLFIGDLWFFYFGFTARGVVTKKIKSRLEKILKWLSKKSTLYVQLFVYVYVGFTPFPNNVLTGMLAMIGYPVKKITVPLLLGDITLPMLTATLVYYYDFSLPFINS